MKATAMTRTAKRAAILLAAAIMLVLGVGAAQAQSYRYMSCSDLWYARNAIYADAGYCFKTARARSVFGRGCFPPFGQLSPWQQRQVNDIQRWEGIRGCR